MIKREIYDSTGSNVIGFYEFDENAEREVFENGKKLDISKDLGPDVGNEIDRLLDDFEDGSNHVCDGYEVLTRGEYTVRRKVDTIVDDRELIPLIEYAKLKNVAPSSVRRKIIRGNLPAKKSGKDWFIKCGEPYIDKRKKSE